ncbi:MAG: AraC family transcriptional regulator [Bryobacteraceae bacterium]
MSQKRPSAADEPHYLVRTLAAEFADGHTLAPHRHSWGQVIYAAGGVMTVWTEQGSWVAPPGLAVWAPPGVAHAIRFTGAASLRTLYLRPTLAELSGQSTVVPVTALLRELILRAVELRFLDDREAAHRAMAELIAHELRARPAAAMELPLPQSAPLRRIAEYLVGAMEDRSGHGALARRFGIGERTLERGFAAETGLTLGQWRRQARFLNALRRLGGGAAVKQAALEAGYLSSSAFIAAFRAVFHTTPGRYFQERTG